MKDIKPNIDILKVVDSVKILSKTTYSLNGLVRDISNIKIIDPYGSGNLSTTENNKANLKENFQKVLATDIYNLLYNVSETSNLIHSDLKNDFLIMLSQANCGSGTWEEGWTIVDRDNESKNIIVQRDETKFWVKEKDIIPEGSKIKEGSPCAVKVSKEVRSLNSHFYMAFGNIAQKDVTGFDNRILRFYWNLTPEGAIHYLKLITECLNRENIFFKTKVISNPEQYSRADAGVLYIDNSQLSKAIPHILNVHKQIISQLKSNVPLFSKYISEGLGFAEDPNNGSSFGISRSKLIATALYESFLKNKTLKEDVLKTIDYYFDIEGVNSKYPYSSKIKLMDYEELFEYSLKQ